MSSRVRAAALAALLSAVGARAPAQFPPPPPQPPPEPPPPPLAWCLATFVAATIPLPAATWIAPAAPTPGYWQIAWRGWSYVFDCGGAVFDMCN